MYYSYWLSIFRRLLILRTSGSLTLVSSHGTLFLLLEGPKSIE